MKFQRYLSEWEILLEGVYDPSIFKAIFLAGGPGSGKSFVAGQTTPGHGLKMVASDILFEKLAKEAGVSLDKMSFTGPDVEKRNQVRDRAKEITGRQMDKWVKGRLGLVVDGTGKNFNRIKEQMDKVQKLGYDTYMVFVNTTLDVAVERNEKRKRTLPKDFVVSSWKDVQNNMGKFQKAFGASNFLIVDNSEYKTDIFPSVWKSVMKFVKKPVDNAIAQEWIKTALEKRKKK